MGNMTKQELAGPRPTVAYNICKTYEWNHPISKIVNSLIKSGLRIEHFNEFAVTGYKALPFMIEKEKGRWVLPDNEDKLPLMFSIKATKTE